MSKLIVEMEMPKRCGSCPCRHVEFDIDRVAVFCAILDNEFVDDPDSIPSWCPIKGVLPEQHGDLIDRDILLQTFQNADYETYNDYCEAFDTVETAETVIAAERKDDEVG